MKMKKVLLLAFSLLSDATALSCRETLSDARCFFGSSAKTTTDKKLFNRAPRQPFLYMYDRGSGPNSEESIDPSSLGDWRTFRAGLVSSGLRTSEEDGSAPLTAREPRRRTISPANNIIMARQTPALAAEYVGGNDWVHAVPRPEIGGLLCRLPLAVELYRRAQSVPGRDVGAGGAEVRADPLATAASLLCQELSPEATVGARDCGVGTSLLFGEAMGVTAHWFRAAEAVIQRELDRITTENAITESSPHEKKSTTINVHIDKLGVQDREFILSIVDYQNKWQEVELITGEDAASGAISSVTINRPLATNVNNPFAHLLLFGTNTDLSRADLQLLNKFMLAFGHQAGVYIGGAAHQERPAAMIHGLPDLAGAREIAPGAGIYEGGAAAAVEGVLAGKYGPLDFRFFVGRTAHNRREMVESIARGQYAALACARPLALKQCVGLLKPL